MKVSTKSFAKIMAMTAIALFALPNMANAQKREHAQPERSRSSQSRPSQTQSRPSQTQTRSSQIKSNDKSRSGDNRSNNNNNNKNSGNRIDNSHNKTNVNINVDRSKDIKINNSHNTTVRRNNNIHYGSPYRYGGHSYYCSRPYYYHPYRPFYWGPVWHPWGFMAATLATTAILLSIENQPQPYYYDQGVYYMPSNGQYIVVQAPVGATVTVLPSGYQTVPVSTTINNYYYGGTYYEKTSNGYTVVPPTAGTIVENLPQGGTEVTMGSVKYVKIGDTYYQPIQLNGKSVYEVVLMQ